MARRGDHGDAAMKALANAARWVHDAVLGVLIGIALLALTGCGTPQSMRSAPLPLRMEAVATLATNRCEALTAADYTALIAVRNSAARKLRAGVLQVDDARLVQGLGDEVRDELEAACKGGTVDQAALTRARQYLTVIKDTLEQAK